MSLRQPFFALIVLAGGLAAPSFADGAAPPIAPAHDPDAVRCLKALEGSILKQTDDEAVASVKQLVQFWKDPAVGEETKKPIPGLLAWYARRKVTVVAFAGIAGLAEVGKGEGSRNLVAVLESVLARDDAPSEITTAVFAALKKVADPDPAATVPIQKLLLHKDDAVVAKAADVLSGYGGATVEVRRELFEDLLRKFEGLSSTAGAANSLANRTALNKWDVVGAAVLAAVDALSHKDLGTMANARQWFNEHHKNADAWK